MMVLWEGWSRDWPQVQVTRILRLLLSDLGPADEQTELSVEQAVTQLKIEGIDAGRIALELMHSEIFFDVKSIVPGADTLVIAPHGRQIAREFQEASRPRRRNSAARRAILLWLYDGDSQPQSTVDILQSPHGWFYGTQFSEEDVCDAGAKLVQDGLIHGIRPLDGPVIRPELTSSGELCAETFDGDVIAMQKARAGGAGVNIGTYQQQGGNAAFASQVDTQHAVSVTVEQAATDIAAIIDALQRLGVIPEADSDEAEQIRTELVAESASKSGIEHVRSGHALLLRLRPLVEPIYQGLVNAGIHYAEMRIGIR